MTKQRLFWLVLVATLAFPAFAQSWPTKPVRFIMAYPPGGSSDILARPIANELSKSLGQQVVIEYKPGAGSSIGADAIAKSAPDGYTMGMLLTAHAVNASLIPKLPYDSVKDFASITLAATLPLVITVNAQSPMQTLQDLINTAKASPGKLNYGSPGPSIFLSVEHFKTAVGVNFTHVPYKGSGPVVAALLGREVDLVFDSISSSLAQIQAGKFRALAVTTSKRSHVLPQVPTVQESGVPGYDNSLWYGIFAAAGTPPAIVRRLNAEIVKAMAQPKSKESIEGYGYQIVGSTPEHMDALLRTEVVRWAKVVKDSGIKVD
jgi:tripartite-type tricarboxylate transporter receptor subunit TctC